MNGGHQGLREHQNSSTSSRKAELIHKAVTDGRHQGLCEHQNSSMPSRRALLHEGVMNGRHQGLHEHQSLSMNGRQQSLHEHQNSSIPSRRTSLLHEEVTKRPRPRFPGHQHSAESTQCPEEHNSCMKKEWTAATKASGAPTFVDSIKKNIIAGLGFADGIRLDGWHPNGRMTLCNQLHGWRPNGRMTLRI